MGSVYKGFGVERVGVLKARPWYLCHYSGPSDVGCEHKMIFAGLAKIILVMFLEGFWV